MNHYSSHHDVPQDVTFFIGPIGTPNGKKAYQIAVDLNDRGDRSALNELLELENEAKKVSRPSFFSSHFSMWSSPEKVVHLYS